MATPPPNNRRGPKLKSKQRAQLLEMLAARERHLDIATALGVTKEAVEYHAAQNKELIAQLRAERDSALINQGLRNRQNRVDQLEDLAIRTKELLIENELLAEEIRMAGNGNTVRYKVYAESAVRQYRGFLDDIAKEMGDRKNISELSGPDGGAIPTKAVIGFDPAEWDKIKGSNDASS
jgi:hypothetical protein